MYRYVFVLLFFTNSLAIAQTELCETDFLRSATGREVLNLFEEMDDRNFIQRWNLPSGIYIMRQPCENGELPLIVAARVGANPSVMRVFLENTFHDIAIVRQAIGIVRQRLESGEQYPEDITLYDQLQGKEDALLRLLMQEPPSRRIF